MYRGYNQVLSKSINHHRLRIMKHDARNKPLHKISYDLFGDSDHMRRKQGSTTRSTLAISASQHILTTNEVYWSNGYHLVCLIHFLLTLKRRL